MVTPLGALSVLIGYVLIHSFHPVNPAHSAVLASFLLNEELGHLGRLGCTLSLIGSLIIVLNAPEDKKLETVDEILVYAMHPGAFISCRSTCIAAR